LGGEFLCVDRQTDVTKPIVTFHDLAIAPNAVFRGQKINE